VLQDVAQPGWDAAQALPQDSTQLGQDVTQAVQQDVAQAVLATSVRRKKMQCLSFILAAPQFPVQCSESVTFWQGSGCGSGIGSVSKSSVTTATNEKDSTFHFDAEIGQIFQTIQ
jgi:hypothetical protein